MDSKNIEKTYGIRIPVAEYGDYYINTLKKSKEYENLPRQIEAYERLEFSIGDESIKSLKYKLIEKSVSYLKNIIYEKVLAWKAPEVFELNTNDFKPENGKTYISFDGSLVP